MSEARKLHHLAMNLVHKADEALANGNKESFLMSINEALNFESKAAFLLRDKVEAEPTRSVLFRSAATLAVRCEKFQEAERLIFTALSGMPPAELRSELLNAFSEIEEARSIASVTTENSGSAIRTLLNDSYIKSLRSRALAFKVEPKTKHYSTAIRLDYALDVLRNIRSSYFGFTEADFNNTFEEQEFYLSKDKILNKIKSEDLLIPDLQYASFGVSLSVDSITLDGIPTKIAKWRAASFEKFKEEVIYLNYSSIDDVKTVTAKYSDDQIRAIYNPIISLLKQGSGYTIKLMNEDYSDVERELKPISRVVAKAMIPKKEINNSEDTKLFQTLGLIKEGENTMRKDNILNMEEINYMEFNHETENIRSGKEYLILSESYKVKFVYDQGVFSVQASEFGINISSSSHKEIIPLFYNEVIKLYKRIYQNKKDELSFDDSRIKEYFSSIVSMAALEINE